jgi:polysaccharide export outer membrane protein
MVRQVHHRLFQKSLIMDIKRTPMSCLIAALLLLCGTVMVSGQTQKAPAKELVQYIREASRLGLTPAQIEENATKAGWATSAVKEALAQGAATPAAPESGPGASASGATADTASAAGATAPAANPDALKERGVPDEYRIGAGDVLQISVWKEPEASVGATVVRPDGKISLPLLKEIELVGLTPTEAEKIITARLTKFIPAADVTVVVSAINSKKVYIVGAVKKEGPIPYNYRMTVMQALSEAGGLSDYAKRKKIYILRTQNGKDYRLPFDYEAVLKGERMELNIPLLPGDTLVIPQ